LPIAARSSPCVPDIYYPPLVTEIKHFIQTPRLSTFILDPFAFSKTPPNPQLEPGPNTVDLRVLFRARPARDAEQVREPLHAPLSMQPCAQKSAFIVRARGTPDRAKVAPSVRKRGIRGGSIWQIVAHADLMQQPPADAAHRIPQVVQSGQAKEPLEWRALRIVLARAAEIRKERVFCRFLNHGIIEIGPATGEMPDEPGQQ
jgi:hypothetical protein